MLPYSSNSEVGSPYIQTGPMSQPPRGRSLFKRILEGALIVLAIAGIAFVYYYLFLRVPAPTVGLSVIKPDQVLLGSPFDFTVSYTNTSEQILKHGKLSLTLPEGIVLAGGKPGDRYREEAVGDIPAGSSGKRSFTMIATTGSQTLKRIEVKLRYDLDDAGNSRFESATTADVAVGGAVTELNFSAPQRVLAGEEFDVTVIYRNTSSAVLTDAKLSVEYPPFFRPRTVSSTPLLVREGNSWHLGSLAPGAEGRLLIAGSVVAEEQSFFTMRATINASFEGSTYTLNEQVANIAIAEAPLSITLRVNDREDTVAAPGKELKYSLRYRNTTSVPFENIVIQTALVGSMFDYRSLMTGGAFNSISNTITWNPANTPELGALAPGEEREILFRIKVKDAFPIKRIADKHYALRAEAKIQSPTVPPGVEANGTVSVVATETKVAGDVSLEAPVFYYEPASGIVNTGPYPPRVNKPTRFTVHWRIRATADDLRDVRVRTQLQPGVTFTGTVRSTLESKPVYDERTGEVTWTIARIPATTGTISAPAEAIFQVEVIPASNQLGQNVPIIEESVLTATDDWTGLTLQDSVRARDSGAQDDPRIKVDSRTVKP